MKSQWLDTE